METAFPLCQRDSFATDVKARVVSCVPAKKKGLYDVVLSDTVLFAEGGGQPSDRGTVAGTAVEALRAEGHSTVVHVLPAPLEVGAEVDVHLDWERRLDHMQQHSAQHVITAIAAREPFLHETVGWALFPDRAIVEVQPAAGAPKEIDLAALERRVNEEIRARRAVSVRVVDADNVPEEIRSRGAVPKNGAIRLVSVEGVDSCTCCGTHVANTSDLQAVKLIGLERARSGTVRIVFLAGGRVLSALGACLDNERAIKDKLCCAPSEFVTRLTTLLDDNAALTKQRKKLLADMAEIDGRELAQKVRDSPSHVAALLRAERGTEWAEAVAAAALAASALPDALLVIGGSDGPAPEGAGVILIAGEPARVERAGAVAKDVAAARGGAKKGSPRWQGKLANVERVLLVPEALSK